MSDGFRLLKDIYEKDESFENLRKVIGNSDVIADFYTIFPDLTKVAEPVKVMGKMLVVKIESGIIRNEFYNKRKQMLNRINDYYKMEKLKGIRFTG